MPCGKSFENMFKSISKTDVPVLDTFLDFSEKFNKILRTKLFKTAFSPAFAISQKFYDRKLEAIFANSMEVTFGLPLHTSGKLKNIDATTKGELTHYIKTGELTGNLKEVIDLDGAATHLSSWEAEGHDPFKSVSSAIYEAFGTPMPKENSVLEKVGHATERTLGKLGLDYFSKMAEFDELRTKVNGYSIGKSLGMNDAGAAVFARENFGIPDPRGGGRAAPLINKMFLFGAAHYGGLRALGHLIGDMPKTAATQIAYRILLPKLLSSSAVMSSVLRATASDEDGKKYELLNGMIPTNEKISRNTLLLGAQDGQGNFHNFFGIKLADIKPDWKPWYLRLPQSRELTTVTKLVWPLVEGVYEGNLSKAKTGFLSGASSEAFSGIQPAIQYMINMGQMVYGSNPTDFYRQKGIFSKDVQEAGSLLDKGLAYGKYAAAQQFPSLVANNPFQVDTGQSTGEKVLHNVPLAGPMLRSLVGVSNYGLMEQAKDKEAADIELKSEIRLSTDDDTKDLLRQHNIAQAQLTAAGKKGRGELGIVGQKDRYLTSWYTRVYQHMQQELLAARASGDEERYSYILEQLAKSSADVKEHVSSMKSGASGSK